MSRFAAKAGRFDSIFSVEAADIAQLERKLGRFASQAPTLFSRALNTVTRKRRTKLKRSTQEVVNLKQASINSRLRFQLSSPGHLRAAVKAKEKQPPSLKSFKGTRQTKKGVTATPRKNGKRELHEGAFINTARASGVALVLERKGGSRYPLRGLRGPSTVGLLLGRPGFAEDQETGYADDVSSELLVVVDRFLDKKGSR